MDTLGMRCLLAADLALAALQEQNRGILGRRAEAAHLPDSSSPPSKTFALHLVPIVAARGHRLADLASTQRIAGNLDPYWPSQATPPSLDDPGSRTTRWGFVWCPFCSRQKISRRRLRNKEVLKLDYRTRM
jgi:hypothetical protein